MVVLMKIDFSAARDTSGSQDYVVYWRLMSLHEGHSWDRKDT
jgi:hypothetical protein